MKRIYLIVLAATFISASAILSANAQQATPYQVEYQTPQNYKDFRFPLAVVMLFDWGKCKNRRLQNR